MARDPSLDRLEAEWGIVLPGVQRIIPENSGWGTNFSLAMDSMSNDMDVSPAVRALARQAAMVAGMGHNGGPAMDAEFTSITTVNAAIPMMFTTMIDPEVIRVALAPMAAAAAFGEQKRGDWTKDTIMFPMVEMSGEVSSYGDWNNNGSASANAQWPVRQSYHFQVIIQYGERETERAAEAKLNWVSEQQTAAANALNRYQDLTYFYGVSGLQNYGLFNDPGLPAALTPGTKAAGGTRWILAGGIPNATANEVLADIQSMYYTITATSNGVVTRDMPMTLLMSPQVDVALTFTNSYGVSVADLLQKNFPNLKIKTGPRYNTGSGQLVQMFADKVEGVDTVFCAFTEKLRQHKLIPELSAYKQKHTSGTWGSVVRYPIGCAQLLGV